MGGTPVEWDQAEKLRTDWLKYGIDKAELTTYDVMLNYPDASKQSGVQILDAAGNVKFTSSLMESPIFSERMGGNQPPLPTMKICILREKIVYDFSPRQLCHD